MAARKLRPLSLIHQLPGEFLPLGTCRLAFLGPQNCLPWMFRRKGFLTWDTHKVLHGSGVSGRLHPNHRSLFLLQVHYEVVVKTQKAGEGGSGWGNPRNSTISTHLNPPMLQAGKMQPENGNRPKATKPHWWVPWGPEMCHPPLPHPTGSGCNKAFQAFNPFNSPLRDHLYCKGEKTEIREVKGLVYNLTASI